MRSNRLAWLLVGGVVMAGVGAATPALADTLLFTNGSMLTGQLEGSDFNVVTRDGASTLPLRDSRVVLLGALGGDRVIDAKGRVTSGVLEQPAYTVRLPSGQTVVIPRGQLSRINVSPR
jgi:hypothetical protein